MKWDDITIVTSCRGYGQYFSAWTASIIAQSVRPHHVAIFTHGSNTDFMCGNKAAIALTNVGISVQHEHSAKALDFGSARNCAVAMANTEWVMHLDCDDALLPHALAEMQSHSSEADVICAGYILSGNVPGMMGQRPRLYQDSVGLEALTRPSITSGISPFRRRLWEQSPYRTDMFGAWDSALWIGFARLGARFRATKNAVFNYYQHLDSIFNTRRRVLGWPRVLTTAQLKALRRGYEGVDVIIPRDANPTEDRVRVWHRVRDHYRHYHRAFTLIEGRCASSIWSKGEAIADALEQSTGEILIIADADCIVDPFDLAMAVERVRNGAPWSMPHQLVYRADRQFTARVCEQSADILPAIPFEDARVRDPYEGAPGGGIVIMKRVMYDAIGGIPFAFRGWGSEDRALACLANTLLGPCARGDADLLHLWHEPQVKGAEPAANLRLLRQMGRAAQQGKDALVSMVYTLTPQGTHRQRQGTARPAVKPVPLEAIAKRQAVFASRRRKGP